MGFFHLSGGKLGVRSPSIDESIFFHAKRCIQVQRRKQKKKKKTLIRVCKNDEFKKPWLHNGVLFILFYFCDVAKLAIIHMKIWPNLAIDQI
jgi:hypothetical protein